MSGDEWKGDNPYYLMITHRQATDQKMVNSVVDLDEAGWVATWCVPTASAARWYLVDKLTRKFPLAMVVEAGQTPGYKAKHVGIGSMTPEQIITHETIAYGLGKDDQWLWHFREADITVAGDDVMPIGIDVVKVTNALRLMANSGSSKIVEAHSTRNDGVTTEN
jgi:hypothetical protein